MGTGASKIREQYVEFWRRFGIDARGEYGLVGAGSILRCGFLSFLTYFIPIALLKRKLRDPHHFRSAVAFGAFGASYRTFRVLISRLFSQEEKNRVLHTEAPLIAGAAASLVALAIDKSFISSVFVSWWGVRALRTIPIFQKNIEQTQFGPLAVMALASSILCPAGLKAPEEHHVSYRKFLTDYFECSGCKFEGCLFQSFFFLLLLLLLLLFFKTKKWKHIRFSIPKGRADDWRNCFSPTRAFDACLVLQVELECGSKIVVAVWTSSFGLGDAPSAAQDFSLGHPFKHCEICWVSVGLRLWFDGVPAG